MLWILLGFLGIILGMIVVMCGSMVGGMAIMVAGMVLMCANYVTMMRGRGKDPEQGSLNGPNGKGKQTSDAVSADQPVVGEQSANIWEKMEE